MSETKNVALVGALAVDGDLPFGAARHVAEHVRTCRDCATYLTQLATTSAIVSARGARPGRNGVAGTGNPPDDATNGEATVRNHQHIVSLARAGDPAHADELVQETWSHFLDSAPDSLPSREELSSHLLQSLSAHRQDDDTEGADWADSILHRHRHNAADVSGADLPADAGAFEDFRASADLDRLDVDADRAELFFPDFYSDGPDQSHWVSPPSAWPSVSRVLGPDAEFQTGELYGAVDAALDELPELTSDIVYLVDIEGHSVETASGLLSVDREAVQRGLILGRNHLRGRIDTYLTGN